MKRRIEITLLITITALGLIAFLLTHRTSLHEEDVSSPIGEETTIRNVTHGSVNYWIKPSTSFEEAKRKVLEVGAVYSFRSQVPMDIIYERLGRKVTHRLVPGKPYSFRYDEHNLIQIYEGSHGREEAVDLAPYLSTPMVVVEKMLELSMVDTSDVVYDIGCGDGRIVIMAAKKYGAREVGIDIDPQSIKESREGARRAGVEKRVKFRLGDAMKMDISDLSTKKERRDFYLNSNFEDERSKELF